MYLDPPEPLEVTWSEEGTSVVSDGYARHFIDQAGLRTLARQSTTPRIAVKALARKVGVSENTLRSFVRGRSLQPEAAERLRAALESVSG